MYQTKRTRLVPFLVVPLAIGVAACRAEALVDSPASTSAESTNAAPTTLSETASAVTTTQHAVRFEDLTLEMELRPGYELRDQKGPFVGLDNELVRYVSLVVKGEPGSLISASVQTGGSSAAQLQQSGFSPSDLDIGPNRQAFLREPAELSGYQLVWIDSDQTVVGITGNEKSPADLAEIAQTVALQWG